MKKTATRLIAAALLLCMLIAYFVPANAEAATKRTSGDRYNIMLVIDGSGSLTSRNAGYTDPYNMRYELIGELMGILEEDGHSIGAVVFSGTASSSANPTDAEMEECLMLDTGMLDLDNPAPDGSDVKDYLTNSIIAKGVDRRAGHGTDIGTALKIAQEHILKKQAENGQESFIFLFTDGNTGFTGGSAGVLAKSEENRDSATLAMSQNNIHLFAAFLNNGDKLDDSEMKRLVCAANGINISSAEFESSYIEVENASAISAATTKFLKFLGYIDKDPIIYYEDVHDSFDVPGLGVDEINIRLYTPDGTDLPNMNVQITDPSGNHASNVAIRNSRTYRVYKIVDPQPGQWHIDVVLPKNNPIGFSYSHILSLRIDSMLECYPSATDVCVNMSPEFKCLLTQSGTVITDPNAYIGYNCELEVMNSSTGEIVGTYPIVLDSNGELRQSVLMDTYGYYEAKATFTCGEIVVTSPSIKLDLTNRTPSGTPISTQHLKCGLFQPKSTELDLAPYFSDPEDGANLRYTVSSTTCNADAIDLTGSLLTMANGGIGNGEITLTATDSQGASVSTTVAVETTNVTIFYIIALIVLLILIVVIVIWRIKGTPKPDGTLTMSFDMPHNNKNVHVELDLAVPGANTVNKTNAYNLALDALRNEDQQISAGLYARDVSGYLMNCKSDLSAILVKAAVKKKNGKTIGAIGLTHNNTSSVLYDSSANYFLNGTRFTIAFKGFEEDDEDIFGSRNYAPAAKQKYNPFDDLYDNSPFGNPQTPSASQSSSQSSSQKNQGKSNTDDFDFF